MYRIDRHPWGFRLTFGGYIAAAEMRQWAEESKRVVTKSPTEFGVFVDMRNLKPLADDAQQIMVTGQQHYQAAGMVRSVVIVDSTLTAIQFKRLAKESGIDAFERYIASTEPDWEGRAIAWLREAVDPDQGQGS